MLKWISSNPILAGLAALALLALIYGGYSYLNNRADKHDAGLVKQGEQSERLKSNEEVFNAIQAADNAVVNPQPDDVERMRQKYDRTRRQDNP